MKLANQKKRWLTSLLVLTVLVLATACGASEQAGNDDDVLGTTRQPGGPAEIALTAKDTKFSMDTITVPAGSHVVVTFTNQDAMAHNFAVYKDDSLSSPIFVGDLVEGPDKTVTYEFDAPAEPGTYYFQCDPHAAEMNGKLVVK